MAQGKKNLSEEFRSEKDGKMKALDVFVNETRAYFEMIGRDEITQEQYPAICKEMRMLFKTVDEADGALSYEDDRLLVNIKARWMHFEETNGLTDEVIEAAELKFKTATGRQTARPVYPRRFDV